MILSLAAATLLALQVPTASQDSAKAKQAGDTSSVTVCLGVGCPGNRRAPERIAVTRQHLATAFRDSAARQLLLRARAARLEQDSAIVSYDAMAHQRISAGLAITRFGRDRLIFRTENASRVRWHRDIGAYVDVKGARTVMPGIPRDGQDDAAQDVREEAADMAPLPYIPGQETLWFGSGAVKTEVDERSMVHPLAEGAEAYYTYESGDVAGFRLPDGREVRLRELKVRPRTVRWNVVVGSLWFDVDRGQLVRAAYRFAEPMDVWAEARRQDEDGDEDIPVAVRGLISPMHAQVTGVAIEYGLHQGRFWLPRLQAAEGEARVSFMRVPFRMEQSFRYEAVNAAALDSLPKIEVPQYVLDQRVLDSLPAAERDRWRDSTRAARRAAAKARADSVKQKLITELSPCDTGTVYTVREMRMDGRVPVVGTVPCDAEALASSPELPKSIYDPGEELFDASAREALLAQALTLGAQPAFGLQPPELHYGLQFTRFNRIEGLSVGINATQQFGAGYVADATARLGVADLEPNIELGFARTNLARTIRLGGYNRLVSANDWGNPLSFGSSLAALLWGRDDGFYYRASGIDLTGTRDVGAAVTWRLFAELQRNAAMDNEFSFAKVLGNHEFQPNITADRGQWAGASLRATRSFGLDPRGWRLFTDTRFEGAGGAPDSGGVMNYGRAATDLTISRALGPANSRAPLAALTASAGTSVGDVPVQRLWYLGGTQTVRGQAPGTAAGDSYWFGRLELAHELRFGRASVFGDAGWAGSRTAFSSGRAMSGAGVGLSVLDGLVRLDVARGIHPSKAVRLDLSLDARF